MTWQDRRQIDPLEFIARAMFIRRFNPGGEIPSDAWTEFITTACGKPEADFTALDWRKVRATMNRYLPPPDVVVDPCPYLQWYADTHPECPAE